MLDKLRSLVGPANVLAGIDCSPYVLEGRTPEAVVFPGSKEEVGAILALASERGIPVLPWGGGTALGIGSPPTRVGIVLGLRRLDRVLEHEPGDLTVTAEAGVTLEILQAQLGRRNQWLSLDPAAADRATLGGILASNVSGPRRHLYGTCRDLLIGVTVVSAEGTVIRGGGKVVKNVAGYDLPKLFIGSFGTLGVLVEATFRLRPLPDEDRLVVARFERLAEAGAAARAVMASDLIPSALELADQGALSGLGLPGEAALLFRVDGIRDQVEWQCVELERLLGPLGLADSRVLDGEARDTLWRRLGNLSDRGEDDVTAVMRWAVLPTQLVGLMEQAAAIAEKNGLGAALTAHAGIGIARAVLSGGGTDVNAVVATLGQWRTLARAAGGHAMIEWAPLPVKDRVSVWDEPGPATRLMKSLKARLDPRGILNPGRFVGDI
jgi:glycolate oxidase FAD binding subunit